MCSAGADLRVRRHESPEIERSDSSPRVRSARSVSNESACGCLPRWQASESRTTRGGCERARA